MRKYTYEEKVKAVQLYIKYGRSPALVRHELGYPSKSCLNKWYNKYIKTGDLQKTGKDRNSKYTQEQRQAAIDYYLTHGKSVKRTILALGYPGKSTLCEWLNADVPDESRKWFCKKNSSIVRCSQEQKKQAIIDYCSGDKSPKQISEEYGISPYTIYGWKNKMLGKNVTMRKPKEQISASKNICDLREEVTRLNKQAELLQREVYQLQLEKEVLKKAAEVIKKDQGINLSTL